jgi:hypothetical protein
MFKKDSCDVLRALFHQFGVVDVDTQGKEKTGVSPVNELMRAVLMRGNVRAYNNDWYTMCSGNTSTKLANFASLVVTARWT